ncbi:hypothetical protein FV222_00350 [Methylobacterium sp. WL103]|uniref:ATP-binding protein n=1 Tax=Methylobacterium sp. WL103 TaxID=2603891 RepID=UPI0011CBFF45|nr:ATP-binding protein [Methylobacterium sp. WL103]TXN08955.1 hypothetical protein FV222_00350 [Methylobacterium sp. WL103]
MQVAHVAEPDSHLIIGGGKTRAFQVTASAAAFKIMSDSLYRDKERAAVREIVCNAIDAHAMNGNEAVPVKVTLTEDELKVEDVGPGIHDDKIADIYCTLFASTKVGQQNQTGGFGLGSKAPFAISDHFTVISKHEGIMTLYAMHVGDPATNGTPGAKIMMQTRCEGSGLSVSVPLAPGMELKIAKALSEIVREGGMNVELNGEKLDAPDYTELKRLGYGMRSQTRWGGAKFQVLYANVLYPMDSHDELVPFIQKLSTFTFDSKAFVLYCPPSSISVTPSREALSYNEVTVETLKGILSRLVDEIQTHAWRFLKTEMAALVANSTRENLPPTREDRFRERQKDLLNGVEEIALRWAQHRISNGSYTQRDVAREMLKKPGLKSKRGLRVIASMRHTTKHNFGTERRERIMREVARIVVAGDLMPFLHSRLQTDDKLVPVNKVDKDRGYRRSYCSDAKRVLHISTARDLVKRGVAGLYLVGAKMKSAQIDKAIAKAKALGWEINIVKRPEAVKKKAAVMFGPPCPPRYRGLTLSNYAERVDDCWDHGVKLRSTLQPTHPGTFEKPVAFYGLKATTIQFKPGFKSVWVPNADRVETLIKETIGRTVMAHTRRDVDNLLAGNVRRLEELVLAKLKERVAKGHDYEAFYARLAMAAASETDSRRSRQMGVEEIAREMIVHSRRFAHAAVREPYAPCADRDEAWAYWLMARTVFHARWSEGPHVDVAEGRIINALVEEYRVLAQPLEAARFGEKLPYRNTEHLALFTAFSGSSFGILDQQQREDFLEFAELMARRYIARQQKDQSK